MKTIFITIAETAIARNTLRTAFLPKLLEEKNVRVVILTDAQLTESYRDEFGSDQVVVETIPPIRVGFFERILAFLARNGLVTGTGTIMMHRAYEAGETRVPVWCKQLLGNTIGRLPGFQACVRFCEQFIASHPSVVALFEKYQPSLIFSTVLLNTEIDIPVMREAKRRRIKTVGMVRGWDNLTTYGFLRFIPDMFFAQVDFLKESAIAFHGMRASRIKVVGMPYFDVYSNQSLYVTREEYCKVMSIDPSKKIILYAAIGDFLFPHEGEIADVFEDLIETGAIDPNSVCIFRAHPAFQSPLERMKGMKHVIPDRNADYAVGGLARWDMKVAHTAHLVNSILHSSVLVTAGSTMMIESALLDRPTISVAFDGNTKERYWFSIARFHYLAGHIVNLLKCGGVRVPNSKEELKEMVNDYIAHPEKDAEGRKKLVERFVGPNRGHAAERLGELLLAEL